ncbi:hypothetical protein MRX96_030784 [Rhipicephalus microplus]
MEPSPSALYQESGERSSSSEAKYRVVRTQSPPHIVQTTHTRLPYVVVCTVGVIMVLVGVALSTYKLQNGPTFLELFNRSISLLVYNNSTTAQHGSEANAQAARHLLKHEVKLGGSDAKCKTDACIWMERYLRGKLNTSVSPCVDFYAYVCSSKWYAKDLDIRDRPYEERSTGLLMLEVEKFFRSYLKQNEERYHKYPGVFFAPGYFPPSKVSVRRERGQRFHFTEKLS